MERFGQSFIVGYVCELDVVYWMGNRSSLFHTRTLFFLTLNLTLTFSYHLPVVILSYFILYYISTVSYPILSYYFPPSFHFSLQSSQVVSIEVEALYFIAQYCILSYYIYLSSICSIALAESYHWPLVSLRPCARWGSRNCCCCCFRHLR